MENCQSSCNTCIWVCDERGDMVGHMRARVFELETLCEKLEEELADANALIALEELEKEVEDGVGLYEEDQET